MVSIGSIAGKEHNKGPSAQSLITKRLSYSNTKRERHRNLRTTKLAPMPLDFRSHIVYNTRQKPYADNNSRGLIDP
jgi:hypothetical protein